MREVLRAGADKVAINTAAIRNPQLIRDASIAFGSSTIVVSIEAVGNSKGGWEALVEYGRETTGVDAIAWAKEAVALGAGELMVTSIDREGTGKGFDLELTKLIAESVSVPVIAGGGCGSPADVVEVLNMGRADAVSMASVLHYKGIEQLADKVADDDYELEGNLEFIKSGKSFSKIKPCTINDIKQGMVEKGLLCRNEVSA